jgi:hypothetical protein
MKNITLSVALFALIMTSCKDAVDKAKDDSLVTTETTTTVVKEETTTTPMDSAAMQKAWMDYMTPGEVHKNLALDNGTWNEDICIWESADGQPTRSKSTAVSRMILDGRYQETTHKGSFMGMPFEGIGTLGYDNATKKMVSSWVDNMGTGIMYMTADYDGTSQTMEFKGEVTDPIEKKAKPVRELFTMVDDNTRKMEMFNIAPNGKEYKSMEILMTRKK